MADHVSKYLAACGSFRLSWYIHQRGCTSLFQKYPYILTEDVSEEEVRHGHEISGQLYQNCMPKQTVRYERLYRLLGANSIALTALEIYVLGYMEPAAFQILQALFAYAKPGITVEAAARITYPQKDFLDMYEEMEEAFGCLEHIFFMEVREDSCFRYPFLMDDRLISYLQGEECLDRLLTERGCCIEPAEKACGFCAMERQIAEVCLRIEESSSAVVQISGKRESGRRFAVRQIAARQNIRLLMVPVSCFWDKGVWNQERWKRVYRELLLTECSLCIYEGEENADQEISGWRAFYCSLERKYKVLCRPLFLTTGASVKLLPFMESPVYGFEIPYPSIETGIRLWKQFMKEYHLREEEYPVQELASKMSLTAGQIQRIVRRVSQETGPDQRPVQISKICYQILDDGKYDNIKRISSSYTMEDMKIGRAQKNTLKEICNQVIYRSKVLDEWNLRAKYVYGRGITVLFYGLPGTGKTMGAHVLSSMLGLEIYKVDLSQIVDKYVGETEKRLEQVFRRAENSNMILFFDEADALLGKRGEIKEARDKYANTEVSFLLQRMEEYDGIAIMATNLISNIDPAFMRRFRFTVYFPMPDMQIRKEIWESLLESGRIPREDMDLVYLAEQFELTGANIKNIVWNALFLAASADVPLNMRYIVSSVFREYQKIGKICSLKDFGKYGDLLEEGWAVS